MNYRCIIEEIASIYVILGSIFQKVLFYFISLQVNMSFDDLMYQEVCSNFFGVNDS